MLDGPVIPEGIEKENEELGEIKQLVDSASLILQAGVLTKKEGLHLLEQVRSRAKDIFPDKMETFAIVYETRLKRQIEEFCVPDTPQ
jgi:hypothetical protein